MASLELRSVARWPKTCQQKRAVAGVGAAAVRYHLHGRPQKATANLSTQERSVQLGHEPKSWDQCSSRFHHRREDLLCTCLSCRQSGFSRPRLLHPGLFLQARCSTWIYVPPGMCCIGRAAQNYYFYCLLCHAPGVCGGNGKIKR